MRNFLFKLFRLNLALIAFLIGLTPISTFGMPPKRPALLDFSKLKSAEEEEKEQTLALLRSLIRSPLSRGPNPSPIPIGKGGAKIVYRSTPSPEPEESLPLAEASKETEFAYYDIDLNSRHSGRLLEEIQIMQVLIDIPGVIKSFGIARDDKENLEDWESISHHLELAIGPLTDFIAPSDRKTLILSQLVSIAHQVFGTLTQIHRRGIIHRDIKPGNILITEKGSGGEIRVKIADFDQAYWFDTATNELKTKSVKELAMTRAYAHPHLLRRHLREVDYEIFHEDRHFDLWSTGLTLLNLAKGELEAWQKGRSLEEIERNILELDQGDLEACIDEVISRHRGGSSAELETLSKVLHCTLNVDPTRICDYRILHELLK